MGTGRRSKQAVLRACLDERQPERVTEALFSELLGALAPVSEGHLRRLLRETGIPLAPLVEGIRQDGFEQLERTLLEIDREYADAVAGRDARRAQVCRRAVITAKDHARFALRSPKRSPDERAAKEEMILWMLTWLENPGVFPAWLELRKRARAGIEGRAQASAADDS